MKYKSWNSPMYTCSVLFFRILQCQTSTQSMQLTQHVQPTPPVDFILHQEVHSSSYIKSYRHWKPNWLYVYENNSTHAKCFLCWSCNAYISLNCKMYLMLFKLNFFFGNFWGSTFMYTFLRHVWKSAGLGYSQ